MGFSSIMSLFTSPLDGGFHEHLEDFSKDISQWQYPHQWASTYLSHPSFLLQPSPERKLILNSVKVLQISPPLGNYFTFTWQSLEKLCMPCCNIKKKKKKEKDDYAGQDLTPDFSFPQSRWNSFKSYLTG